MCNNRNFDITKIIRSESLDVADGVYFPLNETKPSGVFGDAVHDRLVSMEDNSWWFRHRNKIIEAGLHGFPPQDNVIVDVGGGNGFVLAHLQEKGFTAILFEPGKHGVANAKKRGLSYLVCATLGKTTVRRSSVPSVGVFDVLEHIENEALFLQEIHDALIGDGRLYVTVPAHNTLWSAEDDLANHIRRYSMKTLNDVLSRGNFEVEYCTYFFSLLSPVVFIFRRLPYLMGKKNVSTSLEPESTRGVVVAGTISKLAEKLFDREIAKIRKGIPISHGASIFAVAKKRG